MLPYRSRSVTDIFRLECTSAACYDTLPPPFQRGQRNAVLDRAIQSLVIGMPVSIQSGTLPLGFVFGSTLFVAPLALSG